MILYLRICVVLLWIGSLNTCLHGQAREGLMLDFDLFVDALESSYEVQFSYPSDLLEDEEVLLLPEELVLIDILNRICSEHELEYHVLEDQTILLRETLLKAELQHSHPRILDFVVLDSANDRPLEMVGANISNTTKGSYSDELGKIQIQVSVEDPQDAVDFHLLGYREQQVKLSKDRNQYVVRLATSSFQIEEVLVVDRVNPLPVDVLEQSIAISPNLNAGFVSGVYGNDIFRSIQLVPGVSAHNDLSSGLSIRGGSDEETLILLDGMPIYNPQHLFGVFSSINSSYVSETSLYKNNFPIEYGGKTSGMVNMNSGGGGGSKEVSGEAEINLLTASLKLNLPIDEHTSLMVAGRSTYQGVPNTDLFELFDIESEEAAVTQNFTHISRKEILSSVPDFTFYDINAKLSVKASQDHSFEINFYRSVDDMDDSYSNEFRARTRQGVVMNREEYINTEGWANLGASLNVNSVLSEKWGLKSTLFYSRYQNDNAIGTQLQRRSADDSMNFKFSSERSNDLQDIGVRSTATYSANQNEEVQFGIEGQKHRVMLTIDDRDNEVLRIEPDASEVSLFGGFRKKTDLGTGINLGLRGSFYSLTSEFYVSPRLGFSQEITSDFTLKASAGRHYQFIRELTFETLYGRTMNFWVLGGTIEGILPVSSSNNFMLGAVWNKDRLTLDLEVYAKETDGVIEMALTNPAFDGTAVVPQTQSNKYRLFQGDGMTRGIDIMAQYASPAYTGWIAYTLSKSTNSFRRILGGLDFPSQDDRRHQINVVNEYRIKDWTLSANYIFASGRPYTDLTKLATNLSREELRPEDRISRLPDYTRIDIGAAYEFKIEGLKANFGVSIYNLLDRQNVNYLQYIFSIPSVTDSNQPRNVNTIIGNQTNLLGRTFNANFKIYF